MQRRCGVLVFLALAGLAPIAGRAGPIIAAGHADLQIANISGSAFSSKPSYVTQMAFGPDGRLYCTTDRNGVLRFDYNSATGALSNQVKVSSISGLGIAFQGNAMYLSNLYDSSVGTNVHLSRLYRLTGDGAGNWTNPIAIVEGIPRDDHGIDNIQIIGDSLYVGIGVRTRNGSFQTFSGDSYGENAYGGSISTIASLTALSNSINNAVAHGQSTENIAGFYLPNPTNAQYQAEINGTDTLGPNGTSVGPLPLTSTAADKLVVHSNGTRNPFGLAVDGDGKLYFSVNQQRISNRDYNKDPSSPSVPDAFQNDGFHDDVYDQLFREVAKGDYGYRNDNWRSHPAGGFFNPANAQNSLTYDNSTKGALDVFDPAHPHGLGPSSSSDGMDFYKGNSFALRYHHQLFITQWNQQISDGGQTLDYRDLVAVDPITGQVTQIASNFSKPLAAVYDGAGNMLVGDYGGSIYRITPTTPFVGAHQFLWNASTSGNWSQSAAWSTPEDASVHLVPHEWGSARYAVTINQPGNITVTLDQNAQIETLNLSDTLLIPAGQTLTVRSATNVQQGGTVSYAGGMLTTPSLVLSGAGKFVFTPGGTKSLAVNSLSIDGSTGSRLDLADGTLLVNYTGASPLGQIQALLTTGYHHNGAWDGPGIGTSLGDTSQFGLGYSDSGSAVLVHLARYGDANLDGGVGFDDLVALARHYGQNNATWSEGDFNYDGNVGFDDLVALARNYGQAPAPGQLAAFDPAFRADIQAAFASVPEPTSLGALALVLGLWRRRRQWL